MGKLIVIEGTDCSGKETQSNRLYETLLNEGRKVYKTSFPMYDSPTGKIVGGPYLGKDYICKGWFPEGATHVNPKVAALYYAADRLYNIDMINKYLEEDYIVILDRYVTSNMAHQAGKKETLDEELDIINYLDKLEYGLLELPKPDLTIFLHMTNEAAKPLRLNRKESLDEHETDEKHLIKAEETYLYLANKYDFTTINCSENDIARGRDDIANDVYVSVMKEIDRNDSRRI